MLDCIIIGGGPAGMSAALYLIRKKMNILLLTPEFGGQGGKSAEIENYLGFIKITGPELMQKFQEHIESFGVESKLEEVKTLTKTDNGFKIKTGDTEYETKSVLITSGKTSRKLGVPGEEEFAGKGVAYCAICDGPLYKDKTVAIIGGGNSALDAGLELEKYAAKVYLVNVNADFQGDEVRKDKVKALTKIELVTEVETTEFFGEQFLKGLKYKTKTGETKELACDGAFIEIGWVPSTDFVKDLVELNPMKEIVVDKINKTNVPGIYAAGDVTDIAEKQIIIAAGEGAKAALNVWKYVVLEHVKK